MSHEIYEGIVDAPIPQQKIYEQIAAERKWQDARWGSQRMLSDFKWVCILGEEVGEVHRAILEQDIKNLQQELVQVAAVAVCWLEALQQGYLDK